MAKPTYCTDPHDSARLIEAVEDSLLSVENATLIAETLSAFSDPTRIRVIGLLAESEMCVGDLCLVGMAGEQFVETGLQVKQTVREYGLTPIVVTHSPHLAYVPAPTAFAQDLEHDYEVQWARGMGMSEDAADRELAAIRRALNALTR